MEPLRVLSWLQVNDTDMEPLRVLSWLQVNDADNGTAVCAAVAVLMCCCFPLGVAALIVACKALLRSSSPVISARSAQQRLYISVVSAIFIDGLCLCSCM